MNFGFVVSGKIGLPASYNKSRAPSLYFAGSVSINEPIRKMRDGIQLAVQEAQRNWYPADWMKLVTFLLSLKKIRQI